LRFAGGQEKSREYPQEKAMPKHRVQCQLEVKEMNRNGDSLYLEIYGDEEKLGTLLIGQGSFTWYARNAKKATVDMNWTRFAALMDECAKS
jgi:hypothetical protein